MAKSKTDRPRADATELPGWVKPQLCKLVDKAPQGSDWLHEIKYDGYRMHARLDQGKAQLLTRTGLDWTRKYPPIAAAVSTLPAKQVYLDGELCGVRPDGKTSFSLIQMASDAGSAEALVFFLFDLLYLDGEVINAAPLRERKERLRDLLSSAGTPLQYSDHQIGRGPEFYAKVCAMSLEGIISKRADASYSPGDRGLWVKVKCENREEFVVVGWTESRWHASMARSALATYYDSNGRLVYAGRVGAAINYAELGRLWRRLQPLAVSTMPLEKAPPRSNRFSSPVVLSRVHWVRPELVGRSSSSPGPRTICCARSSSRGCGRTSPRERCGARWGTKSKFAGGARRRRRLTPPVAQIFGRLLAPGELIYDLPNASDY